VGADWGDVPPGPPSEIPLIGGNYAIVARGIDAPALITAAFVNTAYVKKVKASHTRYRALGPELMPVYRQSAHR